MSGAIQGRAAQHWQSKLVEDNEWLVGLPIEVVNAGNVL